MTVTVAVTFFLFDLVGYDGVCIGRGDTKMSSSSDKLPTYLQTQIASEKKLRLMRAKADVFKLGKDILFSTCGSYARREATTESDLDFFVVHRGNRSSEAEDALRCLGPQLLQVAGRPPSQTGYFGHVEKFEDIVKNIGGDRDSTPTLTRRILLLLEGDWIAGEQLLSDLRGTLVRKYVKSSIYPHNLCLFLLNDIIRYYRTICVDFDFKTVQHSKPWGIRNIKLVYSRQLIYFSGIVLIANTYQRSYSEKVRILETGFAKTPIDRVLDICGDSALPALKLYDEFLKALGDSTIRKQLESTTERSRNKNETYRTLKDNGHHFSLKLLNALQYTFGDTHPIHRALVL
jgi:predicted nucleotidyltransferase